MPAKLRSELGLKAGDKVVFVEQSDGTISVEAKNHSLADLQGIVGRAGAEVGHGDIDRWIEEARGARWERYTAGSGSKES